MDLVEIDAASHRGIDEVRELRDGIRFLPTKLKYRVFIIDEAHQLTREAANALLKTLEEPPAHAVFILATTEVHKMIPTIVSRCQRFDLRKLNMAEILKKLEFICQNEKIKIERAALELIALNAQGSFRDAESLLDQVFTFYGEKEIRVEDIKELLGLVETELITEFCEFLAQKKAVESINFVNKIVENGMDLEEFTKSLINYLRKILVLKIISLGQNSSQINSWTAGLNQEEFQKIKKLAEVFKEEELKKLLNLFLEVQTKLKYSPIPQLPLELAIVEFCEKI
jgi:DNA polymerase-3 subunit gamma/tau